MGDPCDCDRDLDALMAAEGVDSLDLVGQLEHVQELIERALADLDNPARG